MYLLVKPNGARWWRFDYRRPDSIKRAMVPSNRAQGNDWKFANVILCFLALMSATRSDA